MLIDLHVHSNKSDGTLSPWEVIDLAVKGNISVIALTDHDTIDGIDEAKTATIEAKSKGDSITLVAGVELSVSYKNKDIHVLGLFLDTNNSNLIKTLDDARKKREERNKKMAENFRKSGIPITLEKLQEYEENAVITRAHFAMFLVEKGYARTSQEAFKTYLSKSSPYYVSRESFSPKEAIDLIHDANGLSFIAHPYLYDFNLEQIEEMVSDFSDMGIDGIEALYSLNTPKEEEVMIGIARKNNLLISGGSDFHGETKPYIKLGIGKGNLKIPYEIYQKLNEKTF